MTARANKQQVRTVKLACEAGRASSTATDGCSRVSVDAETIAADPVAWSSTRRRPRKRSVGRSTNATPARLRELVARLTEKKSRFEYLGPARVSRTRPRASGPSTSQASCSTRKADGTTQTGRSAAHALGFVGLDNVGLAGVESRYDSRIRGRDGRLILQIDSRREARAAREERAATAGETLELTIDQYLQHIVERELRAGVEEHNAAGGAAVIMDPRTGEILALANYPTFNPNAFKDVDRDRAQEPSYPGHLRAGIDLQAGHGVGSPRGGPASDH